jgi:chorismate dehydratase
MVALAWRTRYRFFKTSETHGNIARGYAGGVSSVMKTAMPTQRSTTTRPVAKKQMLRIGSVSYLNAKPLIHGLDKAGDLDMHLEVPSGLLAGLADRRFDIALLPVIDFQRLENLCLVPVGGIGCDGPTLTVRIFSTKPIEEIQTLACDADSHTSVALARVVLAERYDLHPEFIDLRHSETVNADARLLIGDKVVCEEPPGFDYQLDLGHAWRELTGLPFVFAIWTARNGVDLGDLPERLAEARVAGLAHVDAIIERFAIPRGWPAGMALQYLTVYLKYEIGERQLEAIRLFHQLAAKHGVIMTPRPLVVYQAQKKGKHRH